MALTDWEVILGGGLRLSSANKVSGEKSLSQDVGAGATHIVHSATYNDAPKNVEIRTWMSRGSISSGSIKYHIGIIARKQSNADTYFYGLLCIEIEYYQAHIAQVLFDAGYYINGSQTSVVNEDITSDYYDKIANYWNPNRWRFVRMLAYEISGQFNIIIEQTPDIDTPDVNNPPLDQLVSLASATIDVPSELQNGGACGIIVGTVKGSSGAEGGEPYYDYTQIFY